jgi:hypothetical protein
MQYLYSRAFGAASPRCTLVERGNSRLSCRMPEPIRQLRFDDLVKASGEPEQVTLWAKPDARSDFMKAVDDNRVATIVQHNTGTKKDYGVIGFATLPNATFLLFPKPLPYAAGTKIIGIKYERLSHSLPKGPLYNPAPPKPPKAKSAQLREMVVAQAEQEVTTPAPANKPKATLTKRKPQAIHRFRATVELLARQAFKLKVRAVSATEAAGLIKEQAGQLKLQIHEAAVTRRVSKVERIN